MGVYNPDPADAQNNLPTAKSIASTSHATPIVVTTSAPHGINTGSYVRIAGAQDVSADGDWLAGAVTSTMVTLTTIPSGTSSVGASGGAAAGTILDLGFGVLATLPTDTTDEMTAASVNVPFALGLDEIAYAYYRANKIGTQVLAVEDQLLTLTVKFPSSSPPQIETITMTGGFNSSGVVHVDFAAAAVGDVIEVECTFDATSNDPNAVHCRVALVQDFGNSNVTLGVTGADSMVIGDSNRYRQTLSSEIVVAVAGACRVILQYGGTNTYTISNLGTGALLAKRKRLGV